MSSFVALNMTAADEALPWWLQSVPAALALLLGLVVFLQVRRWASAAVAWGTALQQQVWRNTTAVVNLERRSMEEHLTGAEAGRLLQNLLDEYSPHGPYWSWRPHHCRRQIL